MSDVRVEPSAATPFRDPIYLHWGGIIGGALIAASIAMVLHSFAAGLGLALGSFSPTWRDASVFLVAMAGLYLLLVAIVSYGAGAYVAGRIRATATDRTVDETEFRDGGHGLMVWALATMLTGFLAFATAQATTHLVAPDTGRAGPAASIAGENLIAYDIDRMFRTPKPLERHDMEFRRAEASRILLTAAGHTGITAEDRKYLIALVGTHVGLDPEAAQQRVNTAIVNARENIRRARQSGVILGFMVAAASLLGAAVAWFAAAAGGRHRDGIAPSMNWGWRGPRRVSRAK